MTQKVVINTGYGGFSLSHEAVVLYCELKGLKLIVAKNDQFSHYNDYYLDTVTEDNIFYANYLPRNDPVLLEVIDQLGDKACGECCRNLKIVEIPDGVEWDVCSAEGGMEWVAEKHRTWD